MSTCRFASRRQFLRNSLFAGAAMSAAPLLRPILAADAPGAVDVPPAKVALTANGDRADIAFRALRSLEKEIAAAIGNRRIVIKPNFVSIDKQLAATHAQTIEGILEFLKSINRLDNVIIGESAAPGAAMIGYENFGYTKLADKHGVKLVDFDSAGFKVLHVFDEKDFRPHAVRMSSTLLDPQNFIISAARMKTHDRVIATLSLKNIIFGAPIKDPGAGWGPGAKKGAKSDKPIAHGSGFRAINYNLFALAKVMHPHLSVIEGYEGMEGNGPVGGTPVQHGVCVAGLDWLATDRVGIELMGIDFAKVGYLNFCNDNGLGQGDLKKIQIVGEPIAKHIKAYKLSDSIEKQLVWMKPPQIL